MEKYLHLLNRVEVAAVAPNVGNLHELSDGGGDPAQRLARPRRVEGEGVGLPQVNPMCWGLNDNTANLKRKSQKFVKSLFLIDSYY